MSAIKTCGKCNRLYTGSTPLCGSCYFSGPSADSKKISSASQPKSRAERRAIEANERGKIAELAKHERLINNRESQRKPSKESRGKPAPASSPLNRRQQPNEVSQTLSPDRGQQHARTKTNCRGSVADTNTAVSQVGPPVPMPAPEAGLGHFASADGEVNLHRRADGSYTYRKISQCGCGGQNSNCFKCDGTGYYEKEFLAEDAPERIIDKLRRAEHSPTYVETSFSKDSRGEKITRYEREAAMAAAHYTMITTVRPR